MLNSDCCGEGGVMGMRRALPFLFYGLYFDFYNEYVVCLIKLKWYEVSALMCKLGNSLEASN